MFPVNTGFIATTRLSSKGWSAKGLGPILRRGALKRPKAIGASPAESNLRDKHQIAVSSSV